MNGAFLAQADAWVLVIPILAIFAMGMFGLDEHFVNKRPARRNRSFCEVDGEGLFLSDPDGKPWKRRQCRQIQARIIHGPASARMESRIEKLRS